jgi:hypothetical protein
VRFFPQINMINAFYLQYTTMISLFLVTDPAMYMVIWLWVAWYKWTTSYDAIIAANPRVSAIYVGHIAVMVIIDYVF